MKCICQLQLSFLVGRSSNAIQLIRYFMMSLSFRALDWETAQQLTNPDAQVRTLLPCVWELKDFNGMNV